MKHRNKCSIEFKIKTLDFMFDKEKYAIDKVMVRKWKEREYKLRNIKYKEKTFRKERSGVTYKTMSEAQEEDICRVIVELLKKVERKKGITTKSLVFYTGKINPQFPMLKLMRFYIFIKRNGISKGRIIHIGQIPPNNINKYKDIKLLLKKK